MKIQIYAVVMSVIWLIAMWRACEESCRNYSSDLDTVAALTILFGAAIFPLCGRVWGWW